MNLLDVIHKAKAEKATSLDLSQKELRILPQELFELEDLEELILDRNMLVELPDDICKLKKLKKLSVSENDLMELPDTIGNLSALPDKTRRIFEQSIAETKDNKGLTLTMAVNYGGRREIADAVREIAERVAAGELDPSSIDERCVSSHLYDPEAPDPDLLIRTSGEQRLSNFLIWQTAYSEFYITDTLWPDFDRYGLLDALVDFQGRSRRFGKVDGS